MNETNQTPETTPVEPTPGATAEAAAPPPQGAPTPADQAGAAETDQPVPDEVSTADVSADASAATTEPTGTAAGAPAGPPTADSAGAATGAQETDPMAAELAVLRADVAERTADLQRLSAEYANYRKRVERDRLAVAEQATAQVISALLPILDDLDRARDHGDLVGPFGLMAEQLGATLAKFGLTGFGEVGDAFDPTRHEAVTHQTSADVTEPTCVTVMRRGYLLGERLLRPAMVAVADPES